MKMHPIECVFCTNDKKVHPLSHTLSKNNLYFFKFQKIDLFNKLTILFSIYD